MIRALFPLLVLVMPPGAEDFPARVVGVSDGDTITVLTAEKKQVKVRLHGIDAPETGQDFGNRAKQAASSLAFGTTVRIVPKDTDRYGRTVAEVFLPDGRSINREMVRQGMAWWYRKYAPHDAELARLEAEARAARAGLWAQLGAVAPWDWRRGGGGADVSAVFANRRSGLYHRANCPAAAKMSEKNRVRFATAGAAEDAGYRKAGDCK